MARSVKIEDGWYEGETSAGGLGLRGRLGISCKWSGVVIAVEKGEAEGALDALFDAAESFWVGNPQLLALAAAARAELAARDERVVEVFEDQAGGWRLGYRDGAHTHISRHAALFLLRTPLVDGQIAVRRLPDSEPEKVRPWRITARRISAARSYNTDCDDWICPRCGAVHDTQPTSKTVRCVQCGVLFGEPRDLPEPDKT